MENILLLISIAQRAYSKWLLHRLLFRIVIIVSLVIVISIMVSAAFIGGLYIIYSSLLYSQMGQMMAMLITLFSAIVLIIILIITLMICLRKLRITPQEIFQQSPISSLAMDTLNAFTAGLMAEQDKKPL